MFASSEENLDAMVNYGTDAHGVHCGYTRSAMIRIHRKVTLAICARGGGSSISCNMQL
jgi:hypothetical protein